MRLLKLAGITGLTCASFVAAQPPPPAAATPAAPRPKAAAPASGSYIGVMVQEIDGDRAKTLKLREEAGVEITRVEADSPADKAGLKSGDAILQYNGQRVEGMEQFSRLVRETPPGREVRLDVFRNGAAQTVTVKVAARHPGASVFNSNTFPNSPGGSPFEFQMPDMPHSFMSWQSSMFGIEGESLEGQLAQYFGVKEGVLVRSVIAGSAADKGGLKAGDVIVRVDDSKVTTPTDVTSRLRAVRGKPVSIVVMRDHKEVPLSVIIDEEKRGGFFRLRDFGDRDNGFDYFVSPATPRVISWPRD